MRNYMITLLVTYFYKVDAVGTVGFTSTVCPRRSQWRFRASEYCPKLDWYHCVYSLTNEEYIEVCRQPEKSTCTKGRKVVDAGGNFDVKVCTSARYMPIVCTSNESEDCLFQKSNCEEEGQIPYNDRSTEEDASCICDYWKGYAYVTKPRNKCYCIPSEEDCTCYKKKCNDDSYKLSPDYRCILKTESTDSTSCPITVKKNQHDCIPCRTLNITFHTDIFFEDSENIRPAHVLIMFINFGALVLAAGILIVCVLFETGTGKLHKMTLRLFFSKTTRDEVDADMEAGENITFVSPNNQTINTDDITDEFKIVEEIFRVKVKNVKKECYLYENNLKRQFKMEPRILDMCFMKPKDKIFLVYIDADNDNIVKLSISDWKNSQSQHMNYNPNRLTKINEKEVAVIYKKSFEIIVFDISKEIEKTRVLKPNLSVCIQGIVSISSSVFFLSDKTQLYKYNVNTKDRLEPIKLNKYKEFDTARRMTTCSRGNSMRVFIADENERKIVSLDQDGTFIDDLSSHDRGLQNVRNIAAIEDRLFAATSEGVAVYCHANGDFAQSDGTDHDNEWLYKYSPLLIEYVKSVSHTRSLCIYRTGIGDSSRLLLGLSCVVKRKDCIVVVSFREKDFYLNFKMPSNQ